jgi:hypothetical protein
LSRDPLAAFVGLEVEQIWIWGSYVRLVFDLGPPGEQDTYVDLTEFEFSDSHGMVHRVDVGTDPAAAGPALAVLRQPVTAVGGEGDVLRLVFSNGAELTCPPHPQYEAWTASIPGRGPVSALPAGEG